MPPKICFISLLISTTAFILFSNVQADPEPGTKEAIFWVDGIQDLIISEPQLRTEPRSTRISPYASSTDVVRDGFNRAGAIQFTLNAHLFGTFPAKIQQTVQHEIPTTYGGRLNSDLDGELERGLDTVEGKVLHDLEAARRWGGRLYFYGRANRVEILPVVIDENERGSQLDEILWANKIYELKLSEPVFSTQKIQGKTGSLRVAALNATIDIGRYYSRSRPVHVQELVFTTKIPEGGNLKTIDRDFTERLDGMVRRMNKKLQNAKAKRTLVHFKVSDEGIELLPVKLGWERRDSGTVVTVASIDL